MNIKITFSCLEGRDPSWGSPEIRVFLELMAKYKDEDPEFYSFTSWQLFAPLPHVN
jgi:hypothetical protein